MKKVVRYSVSTLAAVILSGCASPTLTDEEGRTEPNVSRAAMPSTLARYTDLEDTLTCIRETGELDRVTFSVGSFADSTGKINSVADGATGNFLPQGGSAAFITDTIRRAGGQVVSKYFGPPERPLATEYAINGIFNSLDFGRTSDVDLRVSGIGPVIATGWAQLSLTVQLDQSETRLNRQMSMIQRPVRYQQYGFGVGRQFGNELVTGMAGVEGQQRLQMEALNGPIALGVIDVVTKEFPNLKQQCTAGLENLLAERAH